VAAASVHFIFKARDPHIVLLLFVVCVCAVTQLNLAHVDANGVFTGAYTTYAIEGSMRKMGESDAALVRLAAKDNLIKDIHAFAHHSKFSAKH
jgi:hypothetical protein